MPFEQAAEEVWHSHKTKVKKEVLRDVTYRYGRLIEEEEREQVKAIRETKEETKSPAETMLVSEDGSLIHLKTGEWYEVKTVVVGEVKKKWNQGKGKMEVKTENCSYFSRSYRIREFEEEATAELHRRGVYNAEKVVSVGDGATWIQSFTDYHVPQATRILDFFHAAGYIAQAGKAVFGEASDDFKTWYKRVSHQLKHHPPQRTFGELALLRQKAQTDEQLDSIDAALFYLKQRKEMIDYPYFQARYWPIGSGSVESSHKLVVQQRMKQAGMRWAQPHIDPLLAIRNLICNRRWDEGWALAQDRYWKARRASFRQKARKQRPVSPPIFIADFAPSADFVPDKESASNLPYRPAPDHPWRLGYWPTNEAWRWN